MPFLKTIKDLIWGKDRNAGCELFMIDIAEALHFCRNIFVKDEFTPLEKVTDLKCKYAPLIERCSPQKIRIFRRADMYRDLSADTSNLISAFNSLESDTHKHNLDLSIRLVPYVNKILGLVEGRNLDTQQLSCIAMESRNHIVIAGAGTGKTTTIVGYIKYLLVTGKCDIQDILVLSFTNASSSEMKERVCDETGFEIEVSTFHKLGMNIIASVEGKKPTVTKLNLKGFIRKEMDMLIRDEKYLIKLNRYILYNSGEYRSMFNFKTRMEYDEYLKYNQPMTLHNEQVKSHAELDIANFLAENRIRYEYEPSYKFKTSDAEHGQYHPDFYLPDYEIYIEHFGIDENGHVPKYFESTKTKTADEIYHDGMEWKRKTHMKNNTTLIECYYFEKIKGVLLTNLETNLQKHGVILDPVPPEELWNEICRQNNSVYVTIIDLFETMINHIKNRNLTMEQVLSLNLLKSGCEHNKNEDILTLLDPVFNAYTEQLRIRGEIDFNDMINTSADYVESDKYHHNYKYVIVDEYQDISGTRYRLLKAMRNDRDFKLFCVGDDWQSIFRFSGCNISYILDFEKYWGLSEISKIETTYRFNRNLIEISSNFIMQNHAQIKKNILTTDKSEGLGFEIIMASDLHDSGNILIKTLCELPHQAKVYLLGRYKSDIDFLEKNSDIKIQRQYKNETNSIVFQKRTDLDITFLTIHKSKGLQADYVFILNNKNKGRSFPSTISEPQILHLLLEDFDNYPYSEERRLFYVALTRAKTKVWLITSKDNISEFANETIRYASKLSTYICPKCGGRLLTRESIHGKFWGCSNYSSGGCTYKTKVLSDNTGRTYKNRGYLYPRH